jgi:hypothetical protein
MYSQNHARIDKKKNNEEFSKHAMRRGLLQTYLLREEVEEKTKSNSFWARRIFFDYA